MEVLKKNKIMFICIMCVVLLMGVVGILFVINKENEEVSVDNFYDNIFNSENAENTANKGNNANNANTKNLVGENGNQDEEFIYIHIIGEVKNQGIIKLKPGQRIVDAINQAGGATELADFSKINLAYILSDGQKLIIPNINDKEQVENFKYIIEGSGDNILENSISTNKGGSKVNINTATQTELETLTGIGPSTALKIIEYREKNGNFGKIEDLKNVSGIGEAKYEGIKGEITVK